MEEIIYIMTPELERDLKKMDLRTDLFRPDEQARREVQDAYQRPIEGLDLVADLYRDEQPLDYQRSDSAPAA